MVISFGLYTLKGSNRTFMELKYRSPASRPPSHGVLIAPLWNWNRLRHWYHWGCPRSNRTFMELKYRAIFLLYLCLFVLIAPLWNWNNCCIYSLAWKCSVLIAPLWNWNINEDINKHINQPSSNRTFMELKSNMWCPMTFTTGF